FPSALMKNVSDNFQETFLSELRLLLLPLAVASEDGVLGELLFDVTGWELKDGSGGQLVAFVNAYKQLDTLIENPPANLEDALQAVASVDQLFSSVRELQAQPRPGTDQVAK